MFKSRMFVDYFEIDFNYWYNRGMILNMGNVESLRVDVVAEF